MKKAFLFILVVLIGIQLVQAQQLVLLKRRNPSRKYVFKEGENLKLKLKNRGEVLKGPWQYENEYEIIISNQVVNTRNIDWLSVAKKEKGIWVLRKGQDMLLLLGFGLVALSEVNSLIEPENLARENKVYRNSAHMVAGGLVCRGLDRALRKRKVPVGKRFALYLR